MNIMNNSIANNNIVNSVTNYNTITTGGTGNNLYHTHNIGNAISYKAADLYVTLSDGTTANVGAHIMQMRDKIDTLI